MGERPIALEPVRVRHLLAGGHVTARLPLTPRTTIVDGETMYRDPLGGLDLAAAWVDPGPSPAGNPGPYLKAPRPRTDTVHRLYPRLQIGAVLWVREPWLVCERGDSGVAWYAADGHEIGDSVLDPRPERSYHNELRIRRPAGTMPRELSRLTVRVESITPDRALGWAWLLRLVRAT